MTDEERAERYFDVHIAPDYAGLSEDVIAILRRRYIKDVLASNGDAVQVLRGIYP